jgi:hypothetical protein
MQPFPVNNSVNSVAISTTNITSSTPVEKISKLAASIHTLLQEVNNPGDSENLFAHVDPTSAQRDRLSDILRYFKEQKNNMNDMLAMAVAGSSPQTIFMAQHLACRILQQHKI